MSRKNPRSSKPKTASGVARKKFRPNGGRTQRAGFSGRLALAGACVVALLHAAHGQEIPRPSVARQKVQTALPKISNFKVGEVLMRVDATMSAQFTDNVNLQPDGESDVILTPQVGVTFTWAATKLNTLRFRTSLGYAYFVNNQNLNQQQILISPDSALSFDIYTGDFRINFHDQFSLQQDPVTVGAASGVAQLGRFTNIIGVSVLWDANDVIWSLGYDHFNLITTNVTTANANQNINNFAAFDNATDQVSASSTFKVNSALLAGFETTANNTRYPNQPESNFTSYSLGAFSEIQLTRYTHMNVAGGYRLYQTGQTVPGANTQTTTAATPAATPIQGDPSGFYANVSLLHRLNRYYSDSLNFGISNNVDAFSGFQNLSFIRYAGNWRINESFSLGIGLAYENVDLIAGTFFGGVQLAPYRSFTASLNTGYQITRHVGLSLGYQFINRESDVETQSFIQNRTTISIGYRF